MYNKHRLGEYFSIGRFGLYFEWPYTGPLIGMQTFGNVATWLFLGPFSLRIGHKFRAIN